MKLKFYLIIICLIVFGCKNEEPLITKEGICIYDERKGTYYLRVDTETPTEDTYQWIVEIQKVIKMIISIIYFFHNLIYYRGIL